VEKVIAALWKADSESRDAFNARILADLPAKLTAGGASNVRINVEDALTESGAALRQRRGPAQHNATIQFWMPSANALFRAGVDQALGQAGASFAAWLVLESAILPNRAHPPVTGARTGGWAQMAFLTRPARLTFDAWLAIWQDYHTKVAIETQSNFEYIQNIVIRALTPDAPPYAAIVEECFPETALADPYVFFDAVGNQAKVDANLARMMDSCDRFIDRGTIDVIPTSQYNF
jgi:EthD domain